MDGRRFDAWVKRASGDAFRWALERRAGRRGVLASTAAGTLATLSGQTREDALAKKRKRKKKKKKAKLSGQGVCGKQCGTLCEAQLAALSCNFSNPSCVCVKSTSGEIHCADAGIGCPTSPAVDQCQSDADCGPNAVCISTAGGLCCTEPGDAQVNLCLNKCLNLTTASIASIAGGDSLLAGVRSKLLGR